MADLFFPLKAGKVSWDVTKTQKWSVQKYESASGIRKTLVQQKYPAWEFSLNFPRLHQGEVDTLMAYYASCKGSWKSFWYKDYESYRAIDMALEQDESGRFQAVIPYDYYGEKAECIDNVVVYVDGTPTTDFTVEGGLITVADSFGKSYRFDYEYYYKVAFADSISVKQIFKDLYQVSLKLTGVR